MKKGRVEAAAIPVHGFIFLYHGKALNAVSVMSQLLGALLLRNKAPKFCLALPKANLPNPVPVPLGIKDPIPVPKPYIKAALPIGLLITFFAALPIFLTNLPKKYLCLIGPPSAMYIVLGSTPYFCPHAMLAAVGLAPT